MSEIPFCSWVQRTHEGAATFPMTHVSHKLPTPSGNVCNCLANYHQDSPVATPNIKIPKGTGTNNPLPNAEGHRNGHGDLISNPTMNP